MAVATGMKKNSRARRARSNGDKVWSIERAIIDASPDCIKVLSLTGHVLAMNRAGCLALGVPEDSQFGMPWLSLLPECVHPAGEAALVEVRGGRSARFPGQSINNGETRYWDNMLSPICDEQRGVRVILCVSRDVTAKRQLERELEEALSRERLLATEMRHRIKNVFAVVSSLVSISERAAGNNASPERPLQILRERIRSFARASDIVFEPAVADETNDHRVQVPPIVKAVLQPYAGRYRLEGRDCAIPRGVASTMVLLLHELATNSAKYGALSSQYGAVRVRCVTDEGELVLDWIEAGGPAVDEPPLKQGLGSELIDCIARSSGGSVTREWASDGLSATLRIPFR